MEIDKNLFRLKHIEECIDKIEIIVDMLKSFENFENQWIEMRGMRNFITHEYFGLQLDSVWETAVNDIPILKKQIQKIIETF